MADQRYEYDCDVVETGRCDALHATLNDLGRKGWRLAHVVPAPRLMGDPGDLLLVWERAFVVRERGGEESNDA